MAAIWPEIDWRVNNSRSLRMTEVVGTTFINGLGTQRLKRYVSWSDSGEEVQNAKHVIQAGFTKKAVPVPEEDDLEYDRYDQDEGGPEERMLPGFV